MNLPEKLEGAGDDVERSNREIELEATCRAILHKPRLTGHAETDVRILLAFYGTIANHARRILGINPEDKGA